ncbi:MAG: serine O-acetyltransferase [Actinomycetota bacterium]|nr:serine O-acetyltransferase [Actinomycetota bacterium]
MLRELLAELARDVAAARDRDPAARSTFEVVLGYPGVHARWAHRVSHRLWLADRHLAARFVSSLARMATGADIHPGAQLGEGLFIDHAIGLVIGETAEVGEDVTLYHGVTLGGTSLERGKRHPTIGDRVTVGAGAKILGPIEVGDDSRIGANAVVVRPVPPNSVVVGVPGQAIARSRPHRRGDRPDLDNAFLPDLVGASLQQLVARVDRLEAAWPGQGEEAAVGAPATDDFTI